MSARFSHIKYDREASDLSKSYRLMFDEVEAQIENLPSGRAKALAMTKLEECYMWVGKAIRDDQLAREAEV